MSASFSGQRALPTTLTIEMTLYLTAFTAPHTAGAPPWVRNIVAVEDNQLALDNEGDKSARGGDQGSQRWMTGSSADGPAPSVFEAENSKAPFPRAFVELELVAGGGFEPPTFGL
jgi:hypothetical protein